MQIWLQAEFNGCFWDFGDLSWQNIKITAATTDTSWCAPYVVFSFPLPSLSSMSLTVY
jgi:hypothetical protein